MDYTSSMLLIFLIIAVFSVTTANDPQTILDCFLKHRSSLKVLDCWKVETRPTDSAPITKREKKAQTYLQEFGLFYPKLDIIFVDECFYNRSTWSKSFSAKRAYCQLISKRSKLVADSKVRALQDLYSDYVDNVKNDQAHILECLINNLSNETSRWNCWKVLSHFASIDKRSNVSFTYREIDAMAYFYPKEKFAKERLNASFVEFCYYDYKANRSTSDEATFCNWIANRTFASTDPMFYMFQQLYSDYVANEKTDRYRVWKCFAARDSFEKDASSCWKRHRTYFVPTEMATRREANAQAYNRQLVQVSSHMKNCKSVSFDPFEPPKKSCKYLKKVTEVANCLVYARKNPNLFRPCRGLFNVTSEPTDDPSSMARYIALINLN